MEATSNRKMNAKIKPSYDEKRQILGKLLPLDTPFTVILDSSEICNFRCHYCFRSDPDKQNWAYAARQDLMSWDIFEKAFDQIMSFPHDVRQISVSHHGEPLMNQSLPMMVRYMREHGYTGRISMHTNGSRLNEKLAQEIGEAGFSRIIISLQGLNAEAYNKTCGYKLDFEGFLHSFEELYAAKQKAKKGTELFVKIARPALEGMDESRFYEMFEPVSDRMFVEEVVPIWKNNNEGEQDDTRGDMVISKFGNHFPRQRCCRLIFDTIVVLPNGDIYPCTQLLGPEALGNIREKTLKDVWNGEERKQILKRILQLDSPKMCDGCYIRQNSVYAVEDMIDGYREEILQRIEERIK